MWTIPMAQLALLVRQKDLVDDPKRCWTFSDEEFVMKLKRLGL